MAARETILVTGSDGLIGSALCRDLAADFKVVGLDNDLRHPDPRIEAIYCDLTSDADVARAMTRVRDEHGPRLASVIHLAAYYDFSGAPSPLYEQLTVQGTRRLLHALRDFAVEQLVFSSTILVIRSAQPDEVLTEESPVEADWDYPISKLEAERLIRAERGAIPALLLRIAGVYDEDCRCLPIAQQIRRIHRKEFVSFFFPGNPDRGQSFIHLADLVAAVRAAVLRRRELGPEEVLLIGEPDLMSYGELQDVIGQELHGRDWPTLRVPKPLAKAGAWVHEKVRGEEETFIKPWMIDLADRHYPISIDRARKLLSWEPRHRLRHVLPEMLRRLQADPRAWYAKNGMAGDEPAAGRAKERSAG